jgi:dTDP-glucose pyrophosphorylase
MKKIMIVLCLAGLGQRFIKKGYKIPKFLLPSKNNNITILELILKNFISSGNDEFILMLNTRNKNWKKNIQNIGKKLNITLHINFISDTKGQAETAFLATKIIEKDFNNDYKNKPIAFHNGDTILLNRDLNTINKIINNSIDGVIDTFNSASENFSYTSVNSEGLVEEIIEKRVISKTATTGLYVFSNCKTYGELYKKMNKSHKELFISDVYIEALNSGLKIFNIHNENPKDTIILGTPQEYEDWLK